jgi:hypothetical protein
VTFLGWLAQGLGLGILSCGVLAVVCVIAGRPAMAGGFLLVVVAAVVLLVVVAAVAGGLRLVSRRQASH